MSEELQTETNDQQADSTEVDQSEPKSWRDEPGAKAVFKQLTELRGQLEAFEKEKADNAEQARRQELEAKGQYETIIKEKDDKIKMMAEQYASELRQKSLEAATAVISDPLVRAGVIAGCPNDVDIEEYVSSVKAKRPDIFEAPGIKPASNGPAQGAVSGGPQKSLKERLAVGDRDAQREAFEKVLRGETLEL